MTQMRRAPLWLALAAACIPPLAAAVQAPSDSAIRAMLSQRVDAGKVKGVVVGVIDPDGLRDERQRSGDGAGADAEWPAPTRAARAVVA